ncbi:DUF2487 family protein [Paenibacillus sinopodophylli]|uniref:DUF2487 family protein n=1 Tax=Paenibacillus sinopodophylli TaxID=1837342 RepID=UPI00110D0155|nr:DUF2487 family protein [Paenibacillus sinopodophylli]
MKFSEIEEAQWEELSPYLDTCLLPITGMTSAVKPYEATEWLERLRDVMDLIEIPFKGRVVTYPAWHYYSDIAQLEADLYKWCSSARSMGFRYVVIATADKELNIECSAVDLCFKPTQAGDIPSKNDVSDAIRALWSGQTATIS